MKVTQPTSPHPRNRTIAEKQLQLRKTLWPDLAPDDVWSRKKGIGYNTGFTTIPKTLSVILVVIDMLSPKGKPASSVYFDIWCRIFDEGFVTLAGRHAEMAFASGYFGQRAVQTWTNRLEILEELGFIRVKSAPNITKGYALVVNPYKVLKSLHAQGRIDGDTWLSLRTRAHDAGATELEE